jgi:hypothetical protein
VPVSLKDDIPVLVFYLIACNSCMLGGVPILDVLFTIR